MPEDFLLKVSRLGSKTDEILPKVLQAGAEVVESKIKSNLQAVVSDNSTGELVSSLGISSAKQDKDGNFNVKIGFSEPRKDGGSNAMIANILEYGKSGQQPKPFLKSAKSKSKKECIDTMVNALENEVNKL